MRTETITKTIYTFDELSESAQEHALNRLGDINVDHEWWDCTCDDAENIGLEITSFSERDIDGGFIESAESCAYAIQAQHGPDCDTLKDADRYLSEREDLMRTWTEDESGLDEKLDDLDNEFLHDLLEDYRIMLSNEYDYLTSREAIVESIDANGYEFDENGNLA